MNITPEQRAQMRNKKDVTYSQLAKFNGLPSEIYIQFFRDLEVYNLYEACLYLESYGFGDQAQAIADLV